MAKSKVLSIDGVILEADTDAAEMKSVGEDVVKLYRSWPQGRRIARAVIAGAFLLGAIAKVHGSPAKGRVKTTRKAK